MTGTAAQAAARPRASLSHTSMKAHTSGSTRPTRTNAASTTSAALTSRP